MKLLKYLNPKKYLNYLKWKKNEYYQKKIKEEPIKRYEKWLKNNEPNTKELQNQRNTKFDYMPKISILVPLYNTPINYFKEMVDSIVSQTYSNWELCLFDASPTMNKEFINITKVDKRIKYKYNGKNEGISCNSNSAANMATGDYLALLDHDDMLAPFALFEIVSVLNNNKNIDFIYSDEDKFTTIDMPRFDPYFKPDYSLHLLRSNNYICHLSVIKKDLFYGVGCFRKEFDGAQDYDLILRVTEKAKKIVHISKILYHWRFHSGSTASNGNNKLYAYEAGKKAIEEHLKRCNINGNVIMNTKYLGLYSINYELKKEELISIVIVIKNKKDLINLQKCINSIYNSTYKKYEIIIVYNFLLDEKLIKNNGRIKLLNYNSKYNNSKMINFGVNNSKGKYIVLLDVNTEINKVDWLEQLLGVCELDDVSVVGSKIITPQNKIFNTAIIIGREYCKNNLNSNLDKEEYGYFAFTLCNRNLSAVSNICMMVKKESFVKVSGFSDNFSGDLESEDFCLKVRYRLLENIVYNSNVEITYNCNYNKKNILDLMRFRRKWKNIIIKKDPYCNLSFLK